MYRHSEQSGFGAEPMVWHALHTKHQHEKYVTDILAERGFEVFCPTYAEVHRWKDRKKEITIPLFPGYLFFANGLDRKIDLLSAPGVCAIVSFGNVPAIVPENEISAIRLAAASSQRVEPHPFLKERQPPVGAFGGIAGTIRGGGG